MKMCVQELSIDNRDKTFQQEIVSCNYNEISYSVFRKDSLITSFQIQNGSRLFETR